MYAVIYDGCNLYWCQHLGGWVDNIAHATWYGDLFDLRTDMAQCGGQLLVLDPRQL
jgi:hypothetical protein